MKKQEMRKAGSLLCVITIKADIFEWIDTRVGKDVDNFWRVWEFTTGRPISTAKTKKQAIDKAKEILTRYGQEATLTAISNWNKINSYSI